VAEAGDKCANPGCSRPRVHIHHIKHWSVYKTHNAADMIAVCPSCHDEIHNGKLKISDDDLYTWKQVERKPTSEHRAHIYVEPAQPARLLTGSLTIETTNANLIVFELYPDSYRIRRNPLPNGAIRILPSE
jgi:hypothetical protein